MFLLTLVTAESARRVVSFIRIVACLLNLMASFKVTSGFYSPFRRVSLLLLLRVGLDQSVCKALFELEPVVSAS